MIIVTGSRTAIAGYFILSFGLILEFFPKKFLKIFLLVALSLLFLYPLFIYTSYHLLDDHYREMLHIITNGRYSIHYYYIEYFIQRPWGIGLFQGRGSFKSFVIAQGNLPAYAHWLNFYNYEQHSLPIQILSELGIMGYLCWFYFLLLMTLKAVQNNFRLAWGFITLMTCFTFLNGLFEFILYYYLAVIIIYQNRPHNEI